MLPRDDDEPEAGPSNAATAVAETEPVTNEQPAAQPAKKKRKRGKPRKAGAEAEAGQQGEQEETEKDSAGATNSSAEAGVGKKKTNTKADKGKKKLKAKRGAYSLFLRRPSLGLPRVSCLQARMRGSLLQSKGD